LTLKFGFKLYLKPNA